METTRDPSGIIFALVMVAIAVAVFYAIKRLRKQDAKPAPAIAAAQREESTRLRKLVEGGSHVALADGSVAPKCFGCDEPATQRPYTWKRGDGLWDLIRRSFGAPARVRIEQIAFGESVSCAAHLPLLYEHFRLDLGQQEVERAKLESEHETRRARFQREGVYERARADIDKHNLEAGGRRKRQKSEAPAKVVPFVSSGRTGTESK